MFNLKETQRSFDCVFEKEEEITYENHYKLWSSSLRAIGYGEENLWMKFKFPFVTLTRDINTNIVVLLIDLFY